MSDFDVHSDEMRFQSLPNDATVDELLGGRPTSDAEFASVAGFVEELRERFCVGPSSTPNEALALVLASGLTIDKGDLVATSGSNAQGPALQAAGLPKWTDRRRGMIIDVLRTKWGKIGVAVAAAFAAFGGFGVAGALPGPLQHAVANAGTHLGLHLPSSDDDQGADLNDQGDDNNDQGTEVDNEAPDTETTEVDNEAPDTETSEVDNEAPDTETSEVDNEAPDTETTEVDNEAPDTETTTEVETTEVDNATPEATSSVSSSDESSETSPESSDDGATADH